MVVIYSIEGNIGSGKSTLVDILKEYYEKTSSNIIFVPEPVDVWNTIKDTSGETILSKFYGNLEKYAFSFQMMAYISRISLLRKTIREHPNAIIITERSVFTDKNVFAKMLHDDNKIEEVNYQIYLRWFDEFVQELPICSIIYVRASPEVCHNRVLKRNREGEQITLEYLHTCGEYHDNWISNHDTNVLRLNANENLNPTYQDYGKWVVIINKFITYNKQNKQSTQNNYIKYEEDFELHKELCSNGC
jgi:deoxyadenosine/deoxycytidine kinase